MTQNGSPIAIEAKAARSLDFRSSRLAWNIMTHYPGIKWWRKKERKGCREGWKEGKKEKLKRKLRFAYMLRKFTTSQEFRAEEYPPWGG